MIETGLADGRALRALGERFQRLARIEGLADLGRWLGEDLAAALPGRKGLLCLCPDDARDWFCFELPDARFTRWPADHPVLDEIRARQEDLPFVLRSRCQEHFDSGATLWCLRLNDAERLLMGVLILSGDASEQLDTGGGAWLMERASLVSLFVERQLLLHRISDVENARAELEILKDRFVDTVSHELKTPLTSILGFSSLAQREAQALDAPHLPQFLGSILDSARKLEQLIDEVLLLSEMASPEQNLDVQEHSLQELVERFRAELLAERSDAGRVEWPDGPPAMTVLVDERRFLRILEHLVINALSFSAPERPVRVQFSFLPGRRKNDVSDYLRVDVVDQGVGIAREDKERIFQKFYQVDGSITREHGGTGLGLTLAKDFTEAMGGRLWLSSEPGKGSTFSFTVPVPRQEPEGGSSDAGGAQSGASPGLAPDTASAARGEAQSSSSGSA